MCLPMPLGAIRARCSPRVIKKSIPVAMVLARFLGFPITIGLIALDQQPLYFYLLFEHKSKLYPNISLQLLGYMLSIWQSVAKSTPGKLPVIIPLLIYHGRDQWNVGLKLSDLPDYEYLLCDLSQYSADDLKVRVRKVCLW